MERQELEQMLEHQQTEREKLTFSRTFISQFILSSRTQVCIREVSITLKPRAIITCLLENVSSKSFVVIPTSSGFVCTIDTCWSDLELAERLSLKNKDSKCKTFPLKIKQICSSFISHFVPRNSWEQFRLPRIRRRQQMKLF